MRPAVDHQIESVRAMLEKTEAAIARQQQLVDRARQGEGSAALAEIELRVLEGILRQHKDRLRSLAVPA